MHNHANFLKAYAVKSELSNTVRSIIGKNLRAARKARKLSQSAAGDAIGISYQQIQKYESGKNDIRLKTLELLAVAYQQPIDFFFEGTEAATAGHMFNGAEESIIYDKDEDEVVINQFYKIPDPRLKSKIIDLAKLVKDQPT